MRRLGVLCLGLVFSGCGSSGRDDDAFGDGGPRPNGDSSPNGDGPGSDGTTTGGTGGGSDDNPGGPKLDVPGGETGADEPGECAAVNAAAENVPLPADIIFVVDNSGSMDLENNWVQNFINAFSQQIIAANIDVHVVMLSAFPDDGGLCVNPPLGGGGCPLHDDNPPTYTHVDQKIESNDALAKVLETHDQWRDVIRENSIKHVVAISDDESRDISASEFDEQFRALDPSYADYVFHAIVALGPEWLLPCLGVGVDIGEVYIDLATATGGVLGDLCVQDFQPIFDEISTAVVETAPLGCTWEIPPPPEGEVFDPDAVNVELSGGGNTQTVGYVESLEACSTVSDGWYYDDPANPTEIIFCPQTCEMIQAQSDAAIEILFGCETIPAG